MADFTITKYRQLLTALKSEGYRFQTFHEYLTSPSARSIVLRHDVDARPQNSLTLAKIEIRHGLKGTYNFRAKPCSWDEGIIRQISGMGHEIGYHYEELSTHKGDHKRAYEAFIQNLGNLRKLVPLKTICMHGSPTSKHDSRDLWKHYNYKDLQITGEPYFDIDFSKVLYLTDTGRRWDGHKVSVRDKVNSDQNQKLIRNGHPIRSTGNIIRAAQENALPDQIMFTIHPQRWHSSGLLWLKELVA